MEEQFLKSEIAEAMTNAIFCNFSELEVRLFFSHS